MSLHYGLCRQCVQCFGVERDLGICPIDNSGTTLRNGVSILNDHLASSRNISINNCVEKSETKKAVRRIAFFYSNRSRRCARVLVHGLRNHSGILFFFLAVLPLPVGSRGGEKWPQPSRVYLFVVLWCVCVCVCVWLCASVSACGGSFVAAAVQEENIEAISGVCYSPLYPRASCSWNRTGEKREKERKKDRKGHTHTLHPRWSISFCQRRRVLCCGSCQGKLPSKGK